MPRRCGGCLKRLKDAPSGTSGQASQGECASGRGGSRPARPSGERQSQLRWPGGALLRRRVPRVKAERLAGHLLRGDEGDDVPAPAARAREEVDAQGAPQQVREVEVRRPWLARWLLRRASPAALNSQGLRLFASSSSEARSAPSSTDRRASSARSRAVMRAGPRSGSPGRRGGAGRLPAEPRRPRDRAARHRWLPP